MKSRKTKYAPQPSMMDQLMNAIGRISALAAVSGYGAIVSSLAAISIIVLSSAIIFPTWFRSDPTGLIKGTPLDVVLGKQLATLDSTGFTALCPSGDLNFCDFVTATNNHFTIIDERLNVTNGSAISASSVGYNGSTPYYTVEVTDIGAAADDLSTRYYGAVLNFTLTPSRFPTLSFPTNQNTVNEDIGRRLRIIETTPTTTPSAINVTYTPSNSSDWLPAPTELQTAEDQLAARVKVLETTPGTTNITTLPAVNITYTPSNSSNWSPAPTELQTAEDQLAARVKTLENAVVVSDAYTTSFNGTSPQFQNNDNDVGSALYYLADQNLIRKSDITLINNTLNNLNFTSTNTTLSNLAYTNPAFFMNNVTTGEGALNNIVGELLVQKDQITSLTTQVNALNAIQQEYLVLNFGRFGNPTISSTQCTFTVDLSSGVQYITGSSIFQRGNGTLYFNGSSPQGFLFHFSSKISYTSTSNNASIMYIQSTININGSPATTINDLRPSELTTGSMNVEFTTPLFLTPGDTISMTVVWFIQSSAISYTDCTIAPSMQHPFFKFSPFTVVGQTPVLTPSLSYVSGAGTSSAYQNYYAHFTLTTVDQTETPIYSPSAIVAGTITVSSNVFNVACSSFGNSTYNCTYLTTVAGTGTLVMTVNGAAISNSPMLVTVISSVHAPYCSLSSSTTEPVGPIVWTFTMLDINTQPVTDFHDNFVLIITNSYVVGGTIFQQQSPGVGQLAFYAPTMGTMEFRVDVINDVNELTMAGTPSFTTFY